MIVCLLIMLEACLRHDPAREYLRPNVRAYGRCYKLKKTTAGSGDVLPSGTWANNRVRGTACGRDLIADQE